MSKKLLRVFLLGVSAGLSIALAGLLFEVVSLGSNKIWGSLVFSTGLLLVCSFALYLFTGKIGFLFDAEDKKAYGLELLIGYLGNIVGAVAFGYLTRFILKGYGNQALLDFGVTVSNGKLLPASSWYVNLLSGMGCGALVFVGVFAFKKFEHPIFKTLILVASVFAFVAIGFEHCIANMFYFSFSNSWGNPVAYLNILLVTLGNSIGALLIYFLTRFALPKSNNII